MSDNQTPWLDNIRKIAEASAKNAAPANKDNISKTTMVITGRLKKDLLLDTSSMSESQLLAISKTTYVKNQLIENCMHEVHMTLLRDSTIFKSYEDQVGYMFEVLKDIVKQLGSKLDERFQ